ncbi:FG-GAP repeat domain-containing protein [Amycolatopsis solani]|uniref:FG-GAP repeat domain-containing protein n=1 Tax=Amycolatopsis solani TaxID=3028615 RepID=UPI0025B14CD1|nr:VCBS repeat-containing protein [Amycolatopsis sp. MEP2-6]
MRIFLAALLGALVVPLVAAPAPASASTLNTAVSRPEIMARAQNWVNRGLTYDMDGPFATDADGTHSYRRDCSGLVSMAWHLGSSLTTDQFLARARAGNGMQVIPRDSLRPGDAMVRDDDGGGSGGHIELFSHWVNAAHHGDGAYVYSFNKTGQTVQNPYAKNNAGLLGKDSSGEMDEYTFIRYRKADSERVSDFSGDGYADVLGVNSAGDLMYYPNNGLNVSDSTARRLDTGWGAYSHVAAGDFSGDGFADLFGVNAAGALVYFPNNGLAISSSTAQQIGSGWGSFRHVAAGDFSGDGHADILGVNAAGELLYYPNNGLALSSPVRLDTGWDTVKHVMAADFSGDGYADVLAVNAAGNLIYYPNNGLAISSSTAQQIGAGWGSFSQVFASDFSGDDYADVLGVDAAGNLQYYANNGLALSASRQLASGWASFTHAE